MKEGIIYLNFLFNPIFLMPFLYLNSDAWEVNTIVNVTVLLAWKNSKEEENLCLRSCLVFCKKSVKL